MLFNQLQNGHDMKNDSGPNTHLYLAHSWLQGRLKTYSYKYNMYIYVNCKYLCLQSNQMLQVKA